MKNWIRDNGADLLCRFAGACAGAAACSVLVDQPPWLLAFGAVVAGAYGGQFIFALVFRGKR